MLDPDELYFTSEHYKDLLDELGDEIEAEGIAERQGNHIDACEHGFKVWTCLLELIKMLKAESIYDIANKGVTIYDLPYWAICFAEALDNACRKGLSVKKVSYKEHIEERLNDLLQEKNKSNGKAND